ncbi:MAG: hypothetical protein ACUZ8H_00565 [Candidatus Anammoxibacter sp.]
MKLTSADIKNMIRDLSDVTLKIITDLVAYQIRRSTYNKSPGINYIAAEKAVSEFIAENFDSIEELNPAIKKLGTGMEGIETFANKIYDNCYKTPLNFNSIKERISAKKDISLKTITDMVAYKISQSADDKGPEINFLTAEAFVAQYISNNFDDIETFKKMIDEFGDSLKGIEKFSDLVYSKYCEPE